MTVQCHPTESDYEQALAAHGIWAQIASRSYGWKTAAAVIVVAFGWLGAYIVASDGQWGFPREVIVNAGTLAVILSIYPIGLLWTTFQKWRTPAETPHPASIGIKEWSINSKGNSRNGPSPKVTEWILIFIFSGFLVLVCARLMKEFRTSYAFRPPGSSKPMPHLSSDMIFGIAVLPNLILGTLLAAIQRRRLARDLVSSKPELLLPRIWQFNETELSEQSELRQTTMKWEYLQKFLETPTLILLYTSERSFFLVRKSSFADEMQLVQLMNLLMEKVPNGVMQPRGGQGFMVQPIATNRIVNDPPER